MTGNAPDDFRFEFRTVLGLFGFPPLRSSSCCCILDFESPSCGLQHSTMTDPLRSPSGPSAGDLYRLPFGGEELVGWALLKCHPDDASLFLCVPADLETAFLADADRIVEGTDEPLALRCDHSLWLHRDDFWERVGSDRVPRADRVAALESLRCVAGLDEARASFGTVDFDDCQSDWIREVIAPALEHANRWRERLVHRIGTRDASLSPDVRQALRLVTDREPRRLPLAASGSGVFHAAWEAAHGCTPRVGTPRQVPELAQWSFWIDPVGLQPEYHGAHPPRAWALPAGGRRRHLDWERADRETWIARSLEWGTGAVRFAIDGERALELILEDEEGVFESGTNVMLEDARAEANPGEFIEKLRASLIDRGFPTAQVDLRVRVATRVLAGSSLQLAPHHRLAYDAPVAQGVRSGIVGLVVDPHSDPPIGLVTRLEARRAAQWQVEDHLPLNAGRLADLLARLHRASGLQIDGALPERFAFELHAERVGEIAGPSMDIAALLALLDGLDSHRHPILRAACSLVQERQRGADDGELVSVEHHAQKLEAFRREIGRGTLLVCHASLSEEAAGGFSTVWRVRHWNELAQHLDSAGLLDALLESRELSRNEHGRIVERLRALCFVDRRYLEARDLARRFEACAPAVDVPIADHWMALQRCSDPARLLGLAAEALEGNQRLMDEMRAEGTLASHEQLADAENHLASALFEAHQFEASHQLLAPWIAELARDARLLTSSLRARLFTVAARAASVLGLELAAQWMQVAVELQSQAKDPYYSRTLGHQIEVLLRLGRDAEAQTALEDAWHLQACDHELTDHADWFLAMFRAELARRNGAQWSDPRLDAADITADGTSLWALAGYQQAVARQTGRATAERVDRLRIAARFAGSSAAPGSVFALLSELLNRCAAALDGEPQAMCARDLTAPPASIEAWYRDALQALDATGDFVAVDALLARVPHFAGRCAR